LPDWDDEWVVADRERFRMLRLEALERGAERLIERTEYGRAMEAALAATLSDPLRESARRLVVRVHLGEGNLASAVQACAKKTTPDAARLATTTRNAAPRRREFGSVCPIVISSLRS
jgi:DNA-binding SARP family transcriptional activator